METAVSPQLLLDDMKRCSICTELFHGPRMLPCVHIFCLGCIKKWTSRNNRNNRTCPLCRTPFKLPRNRVYNLPKNFIDSQLLQLQDCIEVGGVDVEANHPRETLREHPLRGDLELQ